MTISANSRGEQFHRDVRGIRGGNLEGGPNAYARELARYIKCPSTVRARTFDHFGRGPTLDEIRGMRQQYDASEAWHEQSWRKRGHDDRDQYARPVAEPPRFIDPEPVVLMDCTLPGDIIARIERACGLEAGTIAGPSRLREYIPARQLAAYILRQRGNTPNQVGRFLKRDRTTIMHALRRFEESATPEMRAFAERLA